jgi:protease-4
MRRLRVVLLLLLLVTLAFVWLRFQAAPRVAPGSALIVELEGAYPEAPARPLLSRIVGQRGRPFASLLSDFAKAERDDRIEAVVLRVGALRVGWGKAQEIRAAVLRLREKGRKVIAHVEVERYGANREYSIASAADEVYVAPGARSPFAGLAAEYLFLGGLWEKLGVQVEVERIGRYKSAAETIAGKKMSPANREMANSLLDSVEAQFVASIAEGRGISHEAVRAAIDAAPTTPEEIVSYGLADGIRYFEEVFESLGDPPRVEWEDYAGVDPASVGFAPEATLALVYGTGPVVTGRGSVRRGGDPVLASRTVSEALLEAADDPEIDGILFRVDSPGGSALASDLVWHAARRVKEKGKPLIASLSDVAASGGYYVASAADVIVADPATLTGSIGVFVLRPVVGGLVEKLGIGVEALTRGRHADLFLASRPLSPASRARLRADVEGVYDLFIRRVAEGRSLEPEVVDAVGRGRVWTGEQALERNLIDAVGGLRTGVAKAREALGLAPDADVALVAYPRPRPLMEQVREALGAKVAAPWFAGADLPDSLRRLAELAASVPPGTPALLPPVLVEIR